MEKKISNRQYLFWRKRGLSYEQIAQKFGTTIGYLRNKQWRIKHTKEWKIGRNHAKKRANWMSFIDARRSAQPWSLIEDVYLLLYKSSCTAAQLAKELQRTVNAIYQRLYLLKKAEP